MDDYEDIMHLLGIKQISDVVDMKIEEPSEGDDIYSNE